MDCNQWNGNFVCMIVLAEEDEDMNRRLELYRYRVPENCKAQKDPDCLDNSLSDEEKLEKTGKAFGGVTSKIKRSILECFQKRDDAEFVEAYVQKLEAEANARRKSDQPE